MCDDCFGSGKTSLVWKFRGELARRGWGNNPSFHSLASAVYVNVRFETEISTSQISSLISPESIDSLILDRLTHVLKLSFAREVRLENTSLNQFVVSLHIAASGTKFLVHFDDVGAFEMFGQKFGKDVLYRIWRIGEALRDAGHYYVMTGRSTQLHTIGNTRAERAPGEFVSATPSVLIRLPPLSFESVLAIFTNKIKLKLPDIIANNGKVDEESIRYLFALTSGVPHAVYSALQFCLINKRACSMEAIENNLRDRSWTTPLLEQDSELYRICLELSWAGILLGDDDILCEEPITSVIARLGFYRLPAPASATSQYRLLVPPYMIRGIHASPRSLQSIAEYDNKGSRLECGFRRVLHLRFCVEPNASWSDVGLPYLDTAGVPFPSAKLENTFIFPKIKNNPKSQCTEKGAKQFMEDSHESTDSVLSRVKGLTEFPPTMVPTLYSLMRIGQYYQALPQSSSADSIIRASEIDAVCFQFKHYIKPFTESQLVIEVEKSRADGWNTFLVIVCTSGHDLADGKNMTAVYHEGRGQVTAVLLSKMAVEHFLGARCVQKISSPSLSQDCKTRVDFSPFKSKSRVEKMTHDICTNQQMLTDSKTRKEMRAAENARLRLSSSCSSAEDSRRATLRSSPTSSSSSARTGVARTSSTFSAGSVESSTSSSKNRQTTLNLLLRTSSTPSVDTVAAHAAVPIPPSTSSTKKVKALVTAKRSATAALPSGAKKQKIAASTTRIATPEAVTACIAFNAQTTTTTLRPRTRVVVLLKNDSFVTFYCDVCLNLLCMCNE